MKLLTLFAVLFLSLWHYAQADNFLANPDFESIYQLQASCNNVTGDISQGWEDNTCWDSSADIIYAQDATNPHSGYLSQRISSQGSVVQFVQNIDLSDQVLYNASVWMRSQAPMDVTLMLRQSGHPYTIYAEQTIHLTSQWQKSSLSHAALAENSYFMIRTEQPGIFWVDDAELSAVSLNQATLITPSGNSNDNTPIYTWNAVTNSTWYYLWVNDSNGNKIKQWYTAAQAGCASGSATCSVIPITNLAYGAAQWWIQTWNNSGYGPWSSAKSFTIGSSSIPSTATLMSPSGSINNNTPTYSWNAVSNSIWYYLWVNDSSGNTIKQWYTAAEAGCAGGSGTCSVTHTSTLANGSARWWVQTWNNAGYGPWSLAKSFTIGSLGIPPAATLVSPSGSINTTPTYSWTAASNSTWYYLWVNDSNGNKIKQWYTATQANCANGESVCSVTHSTPLAVGLGQWWIQTWNSSGYGPWSSVKSFTVTSSVANGLFRVSDGRIIAPDGSDFIARGINIYNSTFYPNSYPNKGADAVEEIVGLFPKINMIRFAYQDDGPNNLFWSSTAIDDAFLTTFVKAATSRRIVVLLEDHSTIGNFTWTQGQIDAYTTFAARYKDNPYVWFGTENEPDSSNREGIVQNVRATYDAIRSTGNNNIVCILSRGGGYTEDILTYANYIQGGSVPNYPGSGPGAGGSSVTAMRNVIWDMHLYMWANPSASVEEVENTLWNGIDSQWGPFAGINVYRNGPQSADGIIPVIVGEWGIDWAGDNVQAVILKTGSTPYPVGNLSWNWSAGDPDILVSGNARTPYGDAVNAFIDAGTGVPEPTQP